MTGMYCICACVFLCTSHKRKARLLSFFLSVSVFSLALSLPPTHFSFAPYLSCTCHAMPRHISNTVAITIQSNSQSHKKEKMKNHETREMANNHGTDYIHRYFMANRWQWCWLAMIPKWWQWLRGAQSLELDDSRDENRTVFWHLYIAFVSWFQRMYFIVDLYTCGIHRLLIAFDKQHEYSQRWRWRRNGKIFRSVEFNHISYECALWLFHTSNAKLIYLFRHLKFFCEFLHSETLARKAFGLRMCVRFYVCKLGFWIHICAHITHTQTHGHVHHTNTFICSACVFPMAFSQKCETNFSSVIQDEVKCLTFSVDQMKKIDHSKCYWFVN